LRVIVQNLVHPLGAQSAQREKYTIDGLSFPAVALGGNGASALIDPIVEIDPSFSQANQFELITSPGVLSTPEPASTLVVAIAFFVGTPYKCRKQLRASPGRTDALNDYLSLDVVPQLWHSSTRSPGKLEILQPYKIGTERISCPRKRHQWLREFRRHCPVVIADVCRSSDLRRS
jgi:hypothetical protein